MLAIRQAGDQPVDIYRDEFLIERPMLAGAALARQPCC